MFTGLIEQTGRIERLDGGRGGKRLVASAPFAPELTPGESVAVNGVCLTVVAAVENTFSADLSRATLEATSLGSMSVGRLVNLERPLRADARLGGHFVLGHVDQTSRIVEFRSDGDGYWLGIALPPELAAFAVPKGSIAIDGISLTIAALGDEIVGVQVVPYTFAHTSLCEAAVGDLVNIETDILGKYAVRLLSTGERREAAELER